MSDIFISYAREDRETAEMLASALETAGWNVFWDPKIATGADWRKVLEEELDQARCVVVVWSKVSVESDHVRDEAENARERRILIPVSIDDVVPPLGFQGIQTANLSEWDGAPEDAALKNLVDDIGKKLGPATVAEEEAAATDVGTVRKRKEETEPPTETEERKESGKLVARWNSLPAKSKVLAVSCLAILTMIVTVVLINSEKSTPPQPDIKEVLPEGLVRKDGKIISLKDGAEMVFIPGGKLTMGSEEEVDVKPFYMDKYEVTNEQYLEFYEATAHETNAEKKGRSWVWKARGKKAYTVEDADWRQGNNIESIMKHPVVHVDWHDASKYAEWAGKRLPTEAEWEMAAWGTDGRRYPWGDSAPNGSQCNYADVNTNFLTSDKNANDGYAYTSPVGTYEAGKSPYGLYDMYGNVWEWCFDLKGKEERATRGGGWNLRLDQMRKRSAVQNMNKPDYSSNDLGFRCVKDIEE